MNIIKELEHEVTAILYKEDDGWPVNQHILYVRPVVLDLTQDIQQNYFTQLNFIP